MWKKTNIKSLCKGIKKNLLYFVSAIRSRYHTLNALQARIVNSQVQVIYLRNLLEEIDNTFMLNTNY